MRWSTTLQRSSWTLDDSERAAANSTGASRPSTVGPTITGVERADSVSQEHRDGDEITLVPTRGGRLSALQLQAQLSRLTDRTRLRRLKGTLQAQGAWQQQLPGFHKWLFLLDMCARSVLAPRDFMV